MLEHSFYLSSFDSGEPLEKIIDSSPRFEILEERFNRNPSACEGPLPADPARCALHRIAGIPLKHQSNGIAGFPLAWKIHER